MWRSVVRLRSNPSISTHHGLKKRWYSSEESLPVTAVEFHDALKKFQGSGALLENEKWKRQNTLGLAISGGVDSMALATLYMRLCEEASDMPKCHAFIIDHKVRLESTEEANWVAHHLRSKLGINSSIIPLTWPANYNPAYAPDFETDARRRRYQALGLACKQHDVKNLMVAHHADDQAETILMRLSAARFRTGLQGMKGAEWIPECYGMHGVYHSGKLDSSESSHGAKGHLPFQVEGGDIRVLRPLLGFSKKRLIATCEESGTSWAEDKTNQDHTLTARNTVRHIFANYKLPAALSAPSLVALSQSMQARVDAHKARAEEIFNSMPIKLNIQTGSLIARLPPTSALLDRPIVSNIDKSEAKNTAFFLLERLAELVSPREKAPIGQLANAVLRIYDSLSSGEDQPPSTIGETTVCVFGVLWRLLGTSSSFNRSTSHPQAREWLLSRQPLTRSELSSPEQLLVFPPTSPPSTRVEDTAILPLQSKWHLFDGRFWIRVHNNTEHEIVLRYLSIVDLQLLSNTKATPSPARPEFVPNRKVKVILSQIKPASLRSSLPALFFRTPYHTENGTETIQTLLALPTLDLRFQSKYTTENTPTQCTWDIRYKKVNPGSRTLHELIQSGFRTERTTTSAKPPGIMDKE